MLLTDSPYWFLLPLPFPLLGQNSTNKKKWENGEKWKRESENKTKRNDTKQCRRTDELSLDSLGPLQPENVFKWSHFSSLYEILGITFGSGIQKFLQPTVTEAFNLA